MLPFKQLMTGRYAFESQVTCAGPANLIGKSLLTDVQATPGDPNCLSFQICSCDSTDCNCNRRDLTSVPQNLPTNITTLNLPDNDITTLSQSDFSRYRSLEILRLSSNQISMINNGTFNHLTNLTILVLILNELTTLPSDIFEGLNNLQYLYLSQNQINSLPVNVFEGLVNLDTLFLNTNQLSSLPVGIFEDLKNLTTLRLNNNRLTSLPADIFPVLSSIANVHINNNPWQCDCKMLRIKQMMTGSFEFEGQITCAGPARLSGKNLLREVRVNRDKPNCLSSSSGSRSLFQTKHAVLTVPLVWLLLVQMIN
ncbi:slit homolog 2 protein-like [Branchiostoma floridae]|uniref:Slit homolog 2 protein-like n=1 Tax=Branchiostoma floridae TaxID=7739 RepID=A0A9J7M2J2_BRAFL|nr:slit homolog 2 protein-like [Branchiostoma floridae]